MLVNTKNRRDTLENPIAFTVQLGAARSKILLDIKGAINQNIWLIIKWNIPPIVRNSRVDHKGDLC